MRTTQNTHAATMSIARRAIAAADMTTLEKIANDLEQGIKQHRLNRTDAKHLLGKVRLEIAHRHFQ